MWTTNYLSVCVESSEARSRSARERELLWIIALQDEFSNCAGMSLFEIGIWK